MWTRSLGVSVPERGFVALIRLVEAGVNAQSGVQSSFSPRTGIRGFDTNGRTSSRSGFVHVSVPERGFVALIHTGRPPSVSTSVSEWCDVSVPERGFVALIRGLAIATAMFAERRFSPRAGIRGFDTRADLTDCPDHRRVFGFSPRAGIRGFDTNQRSTGRDQAVIGESRPGYFGRFGC